MKRRNRPGLLLFALATMYFTFSRAAGDAYDLARVKGIETFTGSTGARELLGKNGFVVADPVFKQIFEAYIKSPQVEQPSEQNWRGSVLPSIITTDSAWHTYHFLLEEGVKELEETQAQRLLQFSRQLLAKTKERAQFLGPAAADLSFLASVGLALQDAQYRQSLTAEEKTVADGLRSTGSGPLNVRIGFPLSPPQFRAQSFYTQSPELSDYFVARQWYATVVFRLNSARETRAAIALAALVNRESELLALWKQLSEPFDLFLAPAEDGTLREFTEAATAVAGTNFASISEAQLAEIQKKLAGQLPLPRVSDQLLQPDEYARFEKETRGFRLLPPRRLPCAICFHNTTDPKIPGRMYPSGLDFLAASPELRSPAALRAVQSQFGKRVGDLISKAECGPLPDSLHGDAMRLLAKLQEPLPDKVAPAFRTEAWQDLQLWTQLGGWVEQRHTWALHTKLSVSYMGIIQPPKGMVAPYPEFFSGLAKLARRTAEAFRKAGLEQEFNVKTVAADLLSTFESRRELRVIDFGNVSGKFEQLGQFENRYYEKHQAELEKSRGRDAYQKLQNELETLARRCAQSGKATEAETETLRMYFDCRQNTARLIGDFAPVCDRLTELAKKSLKGETLTEDDAGWIASYGVTLAGFHFYYGNSYEVPRDDFPIVTRVFSNPRRDSMLYAGLARPQALYVIVPNGNALQLYRGAVMTYREFVRPNDQPLEDQSWRELIAKGQTPPAPPFTKSFYAETSVADLLNKLQVPAQGGDFVSYSDIEDILWQIGSRATEKDLPRLIEMMIRGKGEGRADIVDGLGGIIARLPWDPEQKRFIALLASPESTLAHASASILLSRPASLDSAALISGFAKQPPRARRLICVLLSRQPQSTEAMQQLFLKALRDPVDGVRWQAALAIATSQWKDAASEAALVRTLNDTNEIVGAAAAYSLAKLGATNAAPVLLTKLRDRLKSPPVASDEWSPQVMAIVQDTQGEEHHADELLNVDHLTLRLKIGVTPAMQRRAALRVPPQPIDFPMHNYNLADALIEALGELGAAAAAEELFKLRGTDYDAEATRALAKLAPDRLSGELLATARDKQIDSYLRERALVTLGNVSATNRLRDLIPLLEDTTPIEYFRPLPGAPWRVCDRAALTIAMLLGWEDRMALGFMRPEQREELMTRAREWARATP